MGIFQLFFEVDAEVGEGLFVVCVGVRGGGIGEGDFHSLRGFLRVGEVNGFHFRACDLDGFEGSGTLTGVGRVNEGGGFYIFFDVGSRGECWLVLEAKFKVADFDDIAVL